MAERDRCPELVLKGSHRELGRQFGEACRDTIPRLLAALSRDIASRGLPHLPPLTRERALARTHAFLPLFTQYVPTLVEEVRGLAEGAHITFEEALLLQIRGEIACLPEAACTAFAAAPAMTAHHTVLLGQNVDSDFMQGLGLVVQIRSDDAPPAMMWTLPGLLGYHGLNAHGVAHFANQLVGPAWRYALPHYPVKRLLLAQPDLDAVVGLLERYPLCSSANYVLADGRGRILDVEATPTGAALLPPAQDFLVHTNHFLSERFRPTEQYVTHLPDSVPRLARIDAQMEAKRGHLTCDDMKAILSDHAPDGCGICRHDPDGLSTAASLIAEPQQGRLHVAAGPPCATPYVTYTLRTG